MTYDNARRDWRSQPASRNSDEAILKELTDVLRPHPKGLRRWSVMRAIRASRSRTSMDIPQKFEEQVERTFRRFCADATDAGTRVCSLEEALFYRPQETAGEVWALVSGRNPVASPDDAQTLDA